MVTAFYKFIQNWGLQAHSFQDKLLLFITLLSVSDKSPSTISTYVSAIKSQYKLDGKSVENEFLLHMHRGAVYLLMSGWSNEQIMAHG